ncbi:MAG: hypothetical protein Q8O59_01775 [bacterium]|nr:hypothetical protein [bacterium]
MKATNYRGSAATRKMVAEQIAARYGEKEAKKYNPETNCRSYKSWLEEGFQVRKGEKAIKSVTFVEVENESGEVVQKYPKNVNLFYVRQVEKIAA